MHVRALTAVPIVPGARYDPGVPPAVQRSTVGGACGMQVRRVGHRTDLGDLGACRQGMRRRAVMGRSAAVRSVNLVRPLALQDYGLAHQGEPLVEALARSLICACVANHGRPCPAIPVITLSSICTR